MLQIEGSQRPMIEDNPRNNLQPVAARRYFSFFSRQAIELLAVGSGVAVVGITIQSQRTINEQSKVIEDLQNQLSKLALDLKQEQQNQKEAISFLYDKMKDAHKVAFKTGTFPPIDGNVCNSHGELLPIPEGFEEKDCNFFTAGGSSFNGDVQHHVSFFTTQNTMYLPYQKGGGRCWGAYSVLAAKPVMTEQEITQKKHEYRLT